MGFLFRQKKSVKNDIDYRELLLKAKEGDLESRNTLIATYTPFVLKTVSTVCGRYVRQGEDDEVSIGLIAFNEAINSFNKDKNIAFLSFAETVIKRRLIDYFRKEKSQKNYIPFSAFDANTDENSEQSSINYIEAEKSLLEYQKSSEAEDRKEEILRYAEVIKDFGITFSELVEISPRHEDARLRAMEVAGMIASDEELVSYLMAKKELPLKKLEGMTDVSRKTLERQRKYIIAIVLIHVNNFEFLKSYIDKVPGKEG